MKNQEGDLILLKRIRLMRELGISLEQIRELIGNPEALEEIMEQRVQSIEGEVLELNDAAAVCSEIRYDGVTFDGMDADRYLNRLEALAKRKYLCPRCKFHFFANLFYYDYFLNCYGQYSLLSKYFVRNL